VPSFPNERRHSLSRHKFGAQQHSRISDSMRGYRASTRSVVILGMMVDCGTNAIYSIRERSKYIYTPISFLIVSQ
jgi:hypothetical protein